MALIDNLHTSCMTWLKCAHMCVGFTWDINFLRAICVIGRKPEMSLKPVVVDSAEIFPFLFHLRKNLSGFAVCWEVIIMLKKALSIHMINQDLFSFLRVYRFTHFHYITCPSWEQVHHRPSQGTVPTHSHTIRRIFQSTSFFEFVFFFSGMKSPEERWEKLCTDSKLSSESYKCLEKSI